MPARPTTAEAQARSAHGLFVYRTIKKHYPEAAERLRQKDRAGAVDIIASKQPQSEAEREAQAAALRWLGGQAKPEAMWPCVRCGNAPAAMHSDCCAGCEDFDFAGPGESWPAVEI